MLPPTNALPVAVAAVHRGAAWRRWLNVGIFLTVLAGINVLLDAVLPFPDVGEVSDKLAWFARHKDEFDAVFVGSSRVCRQIAPGVFDEQVTAATGRPMHSFNFGAPSMFLPESLFVIDRILAQRPARLRWMFIELDHPPLRLEEHAGLVRREVYWHDLPATALMCVNIFTARSIHKLDRLTMIAHQGLLFGRWWTHLGRGQEWLATHFLPPGVPAADPDEAASLGPANDGYIPYGRTLGQGKGDARDAGRDVKTFARAVAALKAGRGRGESGSTVSGLLRWRLEGKIQALRARGIEPLFVVAPVTTAEEDFLRLPGEGIVRPVFAFNDPAAYPDLYEVGVRADTMHLNERGSLLFTRLLAGRFVQYQAAVQRSPDGSR